MELDFIVQSGKKVIPVEIKSGNDYKKHSSLTQALQISNWNLEERIVFCKRNVEKAENVLYLPWYMAMFFGAEKLPDQMIVKFSWE